MKEINIYKAEKEAGLEHKIKASSCIAYASPLCGESAQAMNILAPSSQFQELSKAAKTDEDLFGLHSILVSTVWNKNDDIFTKEEVWAARNTPQFKPTNLDHDEKQIVGTIIGNWPVDKEFNIIDEDTPIDDVPDLFHILVASVIFRQFVDPEMKARAEKLIEQIQANDKFVSMECIFRGFDYGVLTPDGESHIIARNDDTAFLTEHLRSYGGKGIYQDHKIGRALRNITFSAKGFVDNPANATDKEIYSIIFDSDYEFDFANAHFDKKWLFEKTGVTSKVDKTICKSEKQEKKMSDVLTSRIDELKKDLDEALAANKELSTQLSQVNVARFENDISELESQIAELKSSLSVKDEELSQSQEKVESLSSQLEQITSEMHKKDEEMKDMKEKEKKAKRKASLISVGLSDDDAEAKTEVFANLNDEQFEVVAETFKSSLVSTEEDSEASVETQKEEECDSQAEEASEEVLETVESSENVSLSVESDSEDQLSQARAGLADYFSELLFGQKSNEGDK